MVSSGKGAVKCAVKYPRAGGTHTNAHTPVSYEKE